MENNTKSLQEKFALLQTMSALVNRMGLASKLNKQTYDGDRHIYEALGYPLTLSFNDYYARYDRQDMAKAIIDRPVNATWKGDVRISETDDDKETSLEKEAKKLFDDFGVKSILKRADKLTGLGKYGVIVLGLTDVKNKEDWMKPVTGKPKLLYIKPFSESSASIKDYVDDSSDKRFGMPKTYEVLIKETANGNDVTLIIHHSRVIHLVDDILESEIEGTPRLRNVFNRLIDLEKLVGGDAEMFWKGARPGYAGKLDKDYTMSSATETALKTQLDEYEHNLRRILMTEGVSYEALAQQIADPSSHVNIQIQMISAVTGIPQRILIGSERGNLASSQDSEEWKSYIATRREDYAEIRVLRPFIDKLIELGILPKPMKGKYEVEWEDLFALSEKDKAEVGKTRTDALRAYTANPIAEATIPPDAFLEYFLGLNQQQIELIKEMRQAEIKNEVPLTPEEQAILDKQNKE